MVHCAECGHRNAARVIGVCGECIAANPERFEPLAGKIHASSRASFALPPSLPRDGEIGCRLCANLCRLEPGAAGYCGVRQAGERGILGGVRKAAVSWYHDPLPTNCVADWVCGAGSRRGFDNLAVFFHGCNFDCLFCQNWTHKEWSEVGRHTPEELAGAAGERTACVCFFGGDPGPQGPYALVASRLILSRRQVRICWETNGRMGRSLTSAMVDISLETGGCVKFDLKCWSEGVHRILCGVDPYATRENFAYAAGRGHERREPPLVVASTLLVPGYVEADEVAAIGRFIASTDPEVPWALLAFHPDFRMKDLPCTSARQAEECAQAALEAGVRNVRVGNIHLLGGGGHGVL